jgi:hypothetical protein
MTVTRISDDDYRTHALPCYPMSLHEKPLFIQELEGRIVTEISDDDYAFPNWQSDVLHQRLAA